MYKRQVISDNSRPDGSITQESFKISIETKLSEKFRVDQLTNHLNSFGNESTKLLIALSPRVINDTNRLDFEKNIKAYNKQNKTDIKFISLTFKDIVSVLNETINSFDIELGELVDDYEGYCMSERLILENEFRMLTVACKDTLDDNLNNSVYFDPANRGYSYCTHLGIYSYKCVWGIGRIQNIVTANLDSNGNLEVLKSTRGDVSDEEKSNIKKMISDTFQNLGWDISNGKKFFCVDKFEGTEFKKESKGGLFSKKYFGLNTLLNRDKFSSVKQRAEMLKEIEW